VRVAIRQALTMPHALPGKVALVGFSLGGGESLYYRSQWADEVGFVDRLQVPVVVFAGGRDHFRDGCCTADDDSKLQDAAKSAGKSFDLTVYPEASHDFAKGALNYAAKAYGDALQRTADALKVCLAP
jgi:dienelactone hydrolase